jgi:hypothetical protein
VAAQNAGYAEKGTFNSLSLGSFCRRLGGEFRKIKACKSKSALGDLV